jgi:pantoate--beta-alanine ligase
MIAAQTIDELKSEIARLRNAGKRIAFVPTMGNLHAGHRHLMERAHDHADAVVASLYVNPLQFGAGEDFSAYPRTPDEDRALCEAAGVSLLFFPDDAAVYPRGREHTTRIEVPGISDILCGASRPGHFRGVATVVHRLFRLVAPDVALFGKKDYQQLLVIRLMTEDLGLPVEIVGVDTVRAEDGLALSSRNGYLSAAERAQAPLLFATLQRLAAQLSSMRGPLDDALPEMAAARAALEQGGFRPDYLSVRRQRDLAPLTPGDTALVLLAAAWLGRARLLDNLEFKLNPGP